jgi:hypothetical protein
MARRDIGNAEFIDHDTESGVPKGSGKVAGVRNWTLRLGETDKDTRKSGRSPVTMLPARLAIVNVYQLDDKIKVGGKRDKTKGKKGGKKTIPQDQTPLYIKYGYDLPAVREEDGVALNEKGYPARKPDEDKSSYNKRVFAWANKKGLINKNTLPKPKPKTEAEIAKEEAEKKLIDNNKKIREARDQADAAVRAMNVKQPRWILWDIVKAKKIKTEPTVSYYDQHPDDYERLDPTEENLERIKKSISNAERANILKTKQGEPATIIAIMPTQLQPPTAFYIRKNVLQPTPRRKKMTRTIRLF